MSGLQEALSPCSRGCSFCRYSVSPLDTVLVGFAGISPSLACESAAGKVVRCWPGQRYGGALSFGEGWSPRSPPLLPQSLAHPRPCVSRGKPCRNLKKRVPGGSVGWLSVHLRLKSQSQGPGRSPASRSALGVSLPEIPSLPLPPPLPSSCRRTS